jgi:ferric-dicitrate binding protein FerR (iron transport regulator)
MADDINRLLVRYLNGTASPDEAAEVQRWVEEAPANEELLERLRESWVLTGALPADSFQRGAGRYDTAAELERLMGRIHGTEREPIPFPTHPRMEPREQRTRWYQAPLLRVAALLAVIIGTAVVMSPRHSLFFTPPLQHYTTAPGERTTLRLSDGSRVVLGPASELRLPSRFPPESRDVQLQGTAYFEVAHEPSRPFRVHAGGAVTRVLGTHFVVRAYQGDPTVEVGVAEGRVAVRADTTPEPRALVLGVGEVAQVGPRGTSRVQQASTLAPLLDWMEGRLVFRERPLGEVAGELERWYGVRVRVPDPELAAKRITLSFQDAPLEQVLGVIGFSLGTTYEREGQTVTLRPARAEP